jgi:hypothetical protein
VGDPPDGLVPLGAQEIYVTDFGGFDGSALLG